MRQRNGFKLNNRFKSGFTLLETLIVVAIVAVLAGLSLVAFLQYEKRLRQTGLDARAEAVYHVAQGRLTTLKAGGYSLETLTKNAAQLTVKPENAADSSLFRASSADRSHKDTAASVLLPMDHLDLELWLGGWYVDYDPVSGSVYSVFFAETETDLAGLDSRQLEDLRSRETRLHQGARIGYYGGELAGNGSTASLKPVILIDNSEKLTVNFTCSSLHGDYEGELTFRMEIRQEGSEPVQKVLRSTEPGISHNGLTYSYRWVLDDLSDEAGRFRSQFPDFRPGEKITVTFEVESTNPLVDKASAAPMDTNGLFGFDSGEGEDCAVICYGRHLQNLDAAFSGVSEIITRAVQKSDISFKEGSPWQKAYEPTGSKKAFQPIRNPRLESYTGSFQVGEARFRTVIAGLYAINPAGDAGLFARFDGSSLKDITLTGPRITGYSSVGGLAGSIEARSVTIDGCRVYLDAKQGETEEQYKHDDPEQLPAWLTGENLGGLVGRTEQPVYIGNSFAATVLAARPQAPSARVGGLVGWANAGAVTTEASYADCYLRGGYTGGLVGVGQLSILDSCYAVGYQTASVQASGFVCGPLNGARNAFTACAYTEATPRDAIYPTAHSGSGSIENVYYVREFVPYEDGSSDMNAPPTVGLQNVQGVDYEEIAEKNTFLRANKLGDGFTAETAHASNPYNLINKGLTEFSYPRITGLDHYGDWSSYFLSGTLVYYERYPDNSYGLFGGNVNSLRSDMAPIGDGYGVAFALDNRFDKDDPTDELILSVAGQQVEYDNEINISITNLNNIYVQLIPLQKSTVDAVITEAPASFYQKVDIERRKYASHKMFYFNPLFAAAVSDYADTVPSSPSEIVIRSPRQLYNLSCTFELYSNLTDFRPGIRQEQDLDYAAYLWNDYTRLTERPLSQEPIGSADYPLWGNYYGNYHFVRGISILSRRNPNVGFISVNRGTVSNLFLLSEYDTSIGDYRNNVACGFLIEQRETVVALGTLVGRNAAGAAVQNCAVGGFRFGVEAFRYSSVHAGGLVGVNEGSITASQCAVPSIELFNSNAGIVAGGFVGKNTHIINHCYASAEILLSDSREGSVTLAGFAGQNSGTIFTSYCTTAMVASGLSEVYAFVPAGGSVIQCYYLDGGTFRYGTSLDSFNSQGELGTGLSGESLAALPLSGFARAAAGRSYESHLTAETDYPFPAVVRDEYGRFVHFGDWPVNVRIGAYGVFYWEHEEFGQNSGYHLSYLGTDDVGDQRILTSDNSLCTAHDDGGIITSFGYGYFASQENDSLVELVQNSGYRLGQENEAVSQALSAQMSGFVFHAYTTGLSEENLSLTGADRTVEWKLHYKGDPDYDSNVYESYMIAPFFANSMLYRATPEMTAVPGGTETSPYQIRSVEQLQYINWNAVTNSVETMVEDPSVGNGLSEEITRQNQGFPYLTYVTGTSPRYTTGWEQYWMQTHDVDARGDRFYPIGSLVDKDSHSSNGSRSSIAFFDGAYNGNDYTIRNVNISSTGQCIGLFGITIGAKLNNIILYSDLAEQCLIEAAADGKYWYSVGGLVGYAACGFTANGVEKTASQISNCAISGYRISSARKHVSGTLLANGGWGGANVGGLVGATNMDISNCVAVNDISLDFNYNRGYENVRVGGLIGGLRSRVSYSYAGGSIVSNVPEYGSTPASSVNIWVGGISGGIVMKSGGNLSSLIGLVTRPASVYKCYTYVKMPESNRNQVRRVHAIASNGEMQSTSFAEYLSGSDLQTAGEYPYGIIVEDCYSMAEYASAANTADYSRSLALMQNGAFQWNSANQQNMNLDSPGVAKRGIYIRNDRAPFLSAEEMKHDLRDYLGGGFSFVTTVENGGPVNGKYSFYGTDYALRGQDYPFPTILTQQNAFGTTVNVHYGYWPKLGMFWNDTVTSFDLLCGTDTDAAGTKEVELMYDNTVSGQFHPENLRFTYRDEYGNLYTDPDTGLEIGPVDLNTPPAEAAAYVSAVRMEEGKMVVTLAGRKEGITYISASIAGDEAVIPTADLSVTVTATIRITAMPALIELFAGDRQTVRFEASLANGNVIDMDALTEAGGSLVWTVRQYEGSDEIILPENVNGAGVVVKPGSALDIPDDELNLTALAAGETILEVDCSYTDPQGQVYPASNRSVLLVHIRKIGNVGLATPEGCVETDILPAGHTPGDIRFSPAAGSETYFYWTRNDALNVAGTAAITDPDTFRISEVAILNEDGSPVPNDEEELYYHAELGEIVSADGFYRQRIAVSSCLDGSFVLQVTAMRNGTGYIFQCPIILTPTEFTVRYLDRQGEELGTEQVSYAGLPTLQTAGQDALFWSTAAAALPPGLHYDMDALWLPENGGVAYGHPIKADTVYRVQALEDAAP